MNQVVKELTETQSPLEDIEGSAQHNVKYSANTRLTVSKERANEKTRKARESKGYTIRIWYRKFSKPKQR